MEGLCCSMEQQEELSDILSSAKRNCQNVIALPKNSMPLGNEIRKSNNITTMKNSMATISLPSNFSTNSGGFYFSACINIILFYLVDLFFFYSRDTICSIPT